jgi:spore maturation protein SpmA
VSADYLGLGQASFDLGIEIMTGIKELEREYPKDFTVRPIQISEYYN